MGFSDREWGRESDSQSQPSCPFPLTHTPLSPLAHPYTAVLVRAIFCQNEPTNKHHTAAGIKGKRRSSGVPKCHHGKTRMGGLRATEKIAGAEGVGRETAKGDLDPHRFQETHEKRTMLWMGRRRGANQRPPTQLFAAQRDAMLCSRTAANVLPFFLPKGWWDCWQLFLPEQALWPCPCVPLPLILNTNDEADDEEAKGAAQKHTNRTLMSQFPSANNPSSPRRSAVRPVSHRLVVLPPAAIRAFKVYRRQNLQWASRGPGPRR